MGRRSGKDGGGGTTIVLRREEAAAHGHHGGAWKVAYADFVTALHLGWPENSRWWAGPGVLMWHGGAQAAALGWSMTS